RHSLRVFEINSRASKTSGALSAKSAPKIRCWTVKHKKIICSPKERLVVKMHKIGNMVSLVQARYYGPEVINSGFRVANYDRLVTRFPNFALRNAAMAVHTGTNI